MKTKHTYSRDDAGRAIHRHSRRTPEERVTLASAMLCALAHDTEPTYTGTDPGTGAYQGPPVWEWALKTLAYYVASAQPNYGIPITDARKRRILACVKDGLRMASEHQSIA